MGAEDAIQSAIEEVPMALAAGLVDLDSGSVLCIKTVDSLSFEVLDVLPSATKELFEETMVIAIEDVFKKARGTEASDHAFQEFLISSTHPWHYFGRLESNRRVVLTVTADSDANLGVLAVQARKATNSAVV